MKNDLVAMRKSELRREILLIRDALSPEEQTARSERIFEALRASDFYRNAQNILCYVSFGSEVQTRAFLTDAQKDGKTVYAPRIVRGEHRREMKFYRYDAQALLTSDWGIEEPPEIKANEYADRNDRNTLVVMPGTVFDGGRGRLGYRGGFYDRFLEAHPLMDTCAVSYDLQIVDEVPQDSFDIRPRRIVTESSIIE